jgi:hypothetical protein
MSIGEFFRRAFGVGFNQNAAAVNGEVCRERVGVMESPSGESYHRNVCRS